MVDASVIFGGKVSLVRVEGGHSIQLAQDQPEEDEGSLDCSPQDGIEGGSVQVLRVAAVLARGVHDEVDVEYAFEEESTRQHHS